MFVISFTIGYIIFGPPFYATINLYCLIESLSDASGVDIEVGQ